MNYVESLNLFGTEAKEIPCTKGKGAPTNATKGAVGCLYMDTNTGDIYRCTALSGTSCIWKKFVEEDQIISKAESKFNNQYGNAIKRTLFGERYINLSNEYGYLELPPFEHDIIVKLRRKNLYNCEWEYLEEDCGVTLTHDGGKTILNGTVDTNGMYLIGPFSTWLGNFLDEDEETPLCDLWATEESPLYGLWNFSIQSLGGMIRSGELEFTVEVWEPYAGDAEVREGRIHKKDDGSLIIENDPSNNWFYLRDVADCRIVFHASPGTVFDNFSFACQWENTESGEATHFAPFMCDLSDIVVHSVGIDGIVNTHAPDESGICVINSAELRDLYECELQTNSGVIMEVELHRDINTVIEELTQAIISMGGNV